MSQQTIPPQVAMFRMLNGYQVTQMLAVAARLGIADHLADGPKTAETLASASGVQPDALYRVLRALANMGVFEALSEHRFALTPLGATLRTDHPEMMRAAAMFLGGDVYRAWADLQYSVTTGNPAFEHVFGAPFFDYLSTQPAYNELFNQAMLSASRRQIIATVASYDFTGAARVVDVGGGQGMLLSTILKANPALRGVLFDLPQVVANAEPVLVAAGVADRCEIVSGDFFTTAPEGDILTLSHILHDWDDERAIQILRNCAQALSPTSKLLVIEDIIAPGANDPQALIKDLQVLILNGGRERTAAEFERLLTAAGLRLTRIIPTQVSTRIIESERL
jgi:hypothetical protein